MTRLSAFCEGEQVPIRPHIQPEIRWGTVWDAWPLPCLRCAFFDLTVGLKPESQRCFEEGSTRRQNARLQ
jgi:hypothetical protein